MARLEEKLEAYARSDAYPFHMPGHKRRPGKLPSVLDAAASYDITEISGFDNLHDPHGILLEEMERIARLYGTRETYLSVNGSTGAILAAVSAAVPKGGTLLMERGCHISVYHAACLRDLKLKFLENTDPAAEGSGDFDALIITSPSYEGEVKDVRYLADAAHEKGALLIVDEAHGAHFSFHPAFPVSAVKQGADLVVQSLHKTLPALTQTALLHNVSGRVDAAGIRQYLSVYETSSPSYLLMASAMRCIHGIEDEGAGYFDAYVRRLFALREELSRKLCHLRLVGGPCGRGPEGEEREKPPLMDPGKLLIRVPRPWTGPFLMDGLRDRYHLEAEMSGPDYCLLMTSAADTDEGFDRLKKALFEIDAGMEGEAGEKAPPAPDLPLPETAIPLGSACDEETETISLEEAEGRISGEYIVVYPPDSPLIIPGEVFSREMIRRIRSLYASGMNVTGVQTVGGTGILVKVTKGTVPPVR